MNTLTIEFEDSVFTKLTAFARRKGKSAEELVKSMTTEEIADIDALEALQESQREARARITPDRLKAAFDEISALDLEPIPGDELPGRS